MLLTTANISSIIGASSLENEFIQWSFRQAQVDGETCTVQDGNKAFIGDVVYHLCDDMMIRGNCPELGIFIAANLKGVL